MISGGDRFPLRGSAEFFHRQEVAHFRGNAGLEGCRRGWEQGDGGAFLKGVEIGLDEGIAAAVREFDPDRHVVEVVPDILLGMAELGELIEPASGIPEAKMQGDKDQGFQWQNRAEQADRKQDGQGQDARKAKDELSPPDPGIMGFEERNGRVAMFAVDHGRYWRVSLLAMAGAGRHGMRTKAVRCMAASLSGYGHGATRGISMGISPDARVLSFGCQPQVDHQDAHHGQPISDVSHIRRVVGFSVVFVKEWLPNRDKVKRLAEIQATPGVDMIHRKAGNSEAEISQGNEVKAVEVIIGPQSPLIGKSVKESNIRRHYAIVVAAVHRKGWSRTSTVSTRKAVSSASTKPC
jgi:hypothetical protein